MFGWLKKKFDSDYKKDNLTLINKVAQLQLALDEAKKDATEWCDKAAYFKSELDFELALKEQSKKTKKKTKRK